MKKHLFVTIAALATAITCAQYPVVDKTYPSFISAAVDTKGNLFVLSNDKTVKKITTTGSVAWTTSLWPITQYSSLAIGPNGSVYVQGTDGFMGDGSVLNSYSGVEIDFFHLGPAVTSTGQSVSGTDGTYSLFQRHGDTYLFNAVTWSNTYLGTGLNFVLEPCATGGVFVGIRGGQHAVRKYDSALNLQWTATQGLSNNTLNSDPLKLGALPNGGVTAFGVDSGTGLGTGQVYGSTGAWVNGFTFLIDPSTTQEQLVKPTQVGAMNMVVCPLAGGSVFLVDMMTVNFLNAFPNGTGLKHIFETAGLITTFGDSLNRYDINANIEWNHQLNGNDFDEVLTSADGTKWAVDYDYNGVSRAVRLVSGAKSTADTYVINEDTSLTLNAGSGVLANDATDLTGGITAEFENIVASGVGNVTSTNPNGSFTFVPEPNASGTYSFYYRAKDAQNNLSARTLVRVIVRPVNDKPVSAVESYSVVKGQQLTVDSASGVLSNDTDGENDPLTASLVSHSTVGPVNLNNDGSFTWQAPSRAGTWSFRYRAYDGKAYGPITTVTLNVTDN